MKRILFVLLMMTCSVSWAEWELVSNDNNSDIYADTATIRKKGNFVEMWRMRNYFEVQVESSGIKYRSSIMMTRYGCNDKTAGLVSWIDYSKEYGQGEPVLSVTQKKNDIQDKPIVPGSVSETAWKIACGRK